MTFIYWIIFGALIGWIAGKISKSGHRRTLLQNTIIGIVGSAVGGIIGDMLNLGTVSGFDLGSIILAVIGAILVLWLVGRLDRRR